MKKFVNDPAKFVPEFMKGIALANPDLLDFNAEFQMITRKGGPDNSKVSLIQEQVEMGVAARMAVLSSLAARWDRQ